MTDALLVVAIVLLICIGVLQVLLYFRKVAADLTPIQQLLAGIDKSYERLERAVREEIARNREEASSMALQSRQELSLAVQGLGTTMAHQLGALVQSNEQKLDRLRETVEQRLAGMQADNAAKLDQIRQEAAAGAQKARQEVTTALGDFRDFLGRTLSEMGSNQRLQLGNVVEQLTRLTESMQARVDALKTAVEEKLKALIEDNGKQLDQMRATVDEKLQGTLEKRLGESFKQVSERLETVYKGLGEMQALASGVGDLKKVLTNVKTRGTWGEVQLGALLEQVLTPDQYDTNVSPKGTGERVEFAIRLPGRGGNRDEILWLPIDAKFPIEDYQRLAEAQDRSDPLAAEEASAQLETRIKQCAKDICDKYLNPPRTTDFAILFLPIEGLFAEVIRRRGLPEFVQEKCRVVIAGPTTLWSILNALQMGFRTLTIEKRSSEVWKVLGAVKAEFGKFGEVLDGVKKKLDQASNNIDAAARKSRTIERKLRGVEELPLDQTAAVLKLEADYAGDGDEETESTPPVQTKQ